MTLTDTSSKIKAGTKGDATALSPTVMATVPAILDRVRDGVRKKVRKFHFYKLMTSFIYIYIYIFCENKLISVIIES